MVSRFAIIAAPGYLLLCLLLGGASAAGAYANAFLQAVGVLLLLGSLWNLARVPIAAEARFPIWLGTIFVVIVIASVVPLPSNMWTKLPGRGEIEHGFALLGVSPMWQPISLDRSSTLASLLSIIPPTAIFFLVLQLRDEERQQLPTLVIGFAALSGVLGVFQLLGGSDSGLRFYEITNRSSPVGFFANRNHLATLLLCGIPFCGFLAARAVNRGRTKAQRSSGVVLAVGVSLFLTASLAIVGSLAGYGLFPIVCVASALIYRRARGGKVGWRWLGAIGVCLALFLALALAGPVGQENLSHKSASSSSRRDFAARTLSAVSDFAPVGTGLGTFVNVYRLYDDPNRTDHEYVNHAHDDYLEVALELGLPGLLLVLAFVVWWLRRSIVVWNGEFEGATLARSATVLIAVILIHSLVDYPIRTAAVAAMFALACALLVPNTARANRSGGSEAASSEKDTSGGLRHLSAD